MGGVPNVMHTGRSGMMASKAAIATTGHNIANANTEGYSRQRVHTEAQVPPFKAGDKRHIGMGVNISRVDRVNDEYLNRQIQNTSRELAHFEEKGLALQQLEDVFNEMNGDGLNRLIAQFFNEFRKLANDPNSEAVRQSVKEATQAMVNDFRRIRKEVVETQRHLDARIAGYVAEMNSLTKDIAELNTKIKAAGINDNCPPDLLDQRDEALKKLASYMDLSIHADESGMFNVDIKGVGPLITGAIRETLSVGRTPHGEKIERNLANIDDSITVEKADNLLDVRSTGSAQGAITHSLKGGKIGALIELRDKTMTTALDRLDELAHTISLGVNEIHRQGFDRYGNQGVSFFRNLSAKHRAAEYLDLSDEIKTDANFIATAAQPDAPGDNRIAMSIANLQNLKVMGNGNVSFDDWYNSIVSDVGVLAAKNKSSLSQQKNIQTQLSKMRDQISGVSIDEETANLLQYQHTFDAAAKVIQIADEMLATVLELRR